jgi:hypothetical protein
MAGGWRDGPRCCCDSGHAVALLTALQACRCSADSMHACCARCCLIWTHSPASSAGCDGQHPCCCTARCSPHLTLPPACPLPPAPCRCRGLHDQPVWRGRPAGRPAGPLVCRPPPARAQAAAGAAAAGGAPQGRTRQHPVRWGHQRPSQAMRCSGLAPTTCCPSWSAQNLV